MATKIINFYATDDVLLNGYIRKAFEKTDTRKTDKCLIQVHGMTSNCFKKREKTIARLVTESGVDSICFNNRGSDIIRYVKRKGGQKFLAGAAYEDITESYYDITGAISYAVEKGYKSVYLQGHSLGASKIVYTYNRMKKENNPLLNYVKGLLLLSMVDLPDLFKTYSQNDYVSYAHQKEKEGNVLELMPPESFMHPISVKTFLTYVKNNNEFDFAKYAKEDSDFEELNNISVPLFIRWGEFKELIKKSPTDQVEFMNRKIHNEDKDIGFIAGANHTYSKREEELSSEIVNFLNKY